MTTDTPAELKAAALLFAARTPAAPARFLGRLGAPREADPHGPVWNREQQRAADEPASELRALGQLPVERLLGALELTVGAYDWSGWPDMLAGLPEPPATQYAFVGQIVGQGETQAATGLLDRLRPGVPGVVFARVREFAAQPDVAAMLAPPPEVTDEPAMAAAHGAAHLGLAVAVAGSVVHQVGPPVVIDRVAAAIGLGIGAAARLLRETPMPPAYAAALLHRIRAEYLLPSHSSSRITVTGQRFGLTERELPETADFGANGLVATVDGGALIRTGVERGSVRVDLVVLAEAPTEVEPNWEEIVEVSWHAAEGRATLMPSDSRRPSTTPPWPGDYRLRVHARGRDEQDADLESYRLVVWAAPAAPAQALLRSEPGGPPKPERAYRWVRRSRLQVAATVTLATGVSVAEALRAFGAEPDRPVPIDELGYGGGWAMALDVGGATLVVEENGYQGSRAEVLRAVSTGGRAASMFWNVNALTRLSFAEAGEVISSSEPFGRLDVPPEVAGLDFGTPGGRTELGLVAVERFTGHAIAEADVTRLYDAGVGYRLSRG
ncbi:DUF6461 domain-containing protein [Paractinoplanes lichenicola]|uniref:Uncharacterized protein n=1 Tax=Paractinoplanes lichenicola TaxID=2802976 RepID=A0ABS1VEC9_9ACTN|nr:DUF6461 domain-containing protein [Actinoplanes lichenicola]MBL7252988.1 hypothetical protein [Actinoplanes lichenicola]